MEDERVYEWKMRIMQCSEDIAMIEERRGQMRKILRGIKEEIAGACHRFSYYQQNRSRRVFY